MLSLIRDCVAAGARVVFATAAERTPLSYPLETLGIETQAIQVNDSAFDSWVAELNPALVVFDRFLMEEQFGWRVAEACPSALGYWIPKICSACVNIAAAKPPVIVPVACPA
jgi:hypothetical protein